jgi:hypothetical protein
MDRKLFATLSLLLIIVCLLSTVQRTASEPQVPPPPGTPPPPPEVEPAPPEETTIEERGVVQVVSGPTTMGSVIVVKGSEVQLPENAWVDFLAHAECGLESTCPETPLYVIHRGESQAFVTISTGDVWSWDENAREWHKIPVSEAPPPLWIP